MSLELILFCNITLAQLARMVSLAEYRSLEFILYCVIYIFKEKAGVSFSAGKHFQPSLIFVCVTRCLPSFNYWSTWVGSILVYKY
jgi:hypothetical protein